MVCIDGGIGQVDRAQHCWTGTYHERVYNFSRELFAREWPDCPNLVLTLIFQHCAKRHPAVILPLLACKATKGDLIKAIPFAAACALSSLAAKVFDDVEDKDSDTALYRKIGQAQAINVGTALIFIAQIALLRLQGLTDDRALLNICLDFNCTLLRMCKGQHLDLSSQDGGLSLERYWQITGSKSGHFFAQVAQGGAALGTHAVHKLKLFEKFGYNLGMLIQVADDFKDICESKGKSDLTSKRNTLPIIYGLTVDHPRRARLERLLSEAYNNPKAEEEARRILFEIGMPQYMIITAEMFRAKARNALKAAVKPGSPVNEGLSSLLDKVLPFPAFEDSQLSKSNL